MSRIREAVLTGTTSTAGAATVNDTRATLGRLYAVEWIDGTLSDGVDAVLSAQNTGSGVSHTLLTLTDANDDAWYYPRHATHDETGTGITYDGTREVHDLPLINGVLRLAITSGGSAKTGGCIVYFIE